MTALAAGFGSSLWAQTTVLNGSFTGGTLDAGWTVGGTGYTPVLTASSAGGNIDADGSGWLRLTSDDPSQATYAYDTTSFVSKNATITASFNYVSYGGNGADGITFFLADADETFSVGAYGGSLGYAQKIEAEGAEADIEGMKGGYIGLGIDEFGNYANNSEGRIGGFDTNSGTLTPDAVSVRGPGDGYTGYDYLGGTGTLPVSLDSSGSSRPTETTFKITISATNQLTVYADVGATGTFTSLYDIDLSGYARPDSLIMGFTGSTGGSDNIHEVQAVTLSSVVANLWTNAEGDSQWGTDNSWFGSPSGEVPPAFADVLLDNTYVDTAQTINVATNRTLRSLQIDAPFDYTLNNGTLTFNDGGIDGPRGIFVTQTRGSATHTINADLALNDAIQIRNQSAGVLNLGGDIATGGHAIEFDGTGATNATRVVSGSGSITQSGTGTTTLSGANTYSGGTLLSDGTLIAGHNTALGTGALTITGGNLAGTGSPTLGNTVSLQGDAGIADLTLSNTLTQSGGNRTLTLSGANLGAVALSNNNTGRTLTANVTGDSAINGAISNGGSGAGGFTKTGTGTLTLNGASTYTGTTTISEGTIKLGASNRISDSSNLNLAGGTLDLNGHSERVNDLSFANGTIDFGTTSGANNFMFRNDGTAGGTLSVLNWEAASDRLAYDSAYVMEETFLDNIYFSGYGSGAEVLTANRDRTISGYGGSGDWDFITPKEVVFYTWDGRRNNGNISDNVWDERRSWIGDGSFSFNSSTRIAFGDNGTPSSRWSPDMDGNRTVNAIRFNADNTISYNLVGAGDTLSLRGTLPSVMQLSSLDQTMSMSDISLDTTTIFDVASSGDLIISADIDSNASSNTLVKEGLGSGVLVLSGNNTFDSRLQINGGSVEATNANSLGTGNSSTGNTVVNNGASLRLNNTGSGFTTTERLSLAGDGYDSAGALRNIDGNNTVSGTVTLTTDARIQSDQDTLTLGNTISGTGNDLTLGGAGNITLSGVLATGGGGLTVDGPGTVTLAGSSANTYTGVTTVTAGTLALAKSANTVAVAGDLVIDGGAVSQTASGQIGASTTVTLDAGSYALAGAGSITQSIRKLDTSVGTTVSIGSADTLTLAGNGFSNINGVITGAGALVTSGTGTVYLGGANTHTGGTTIGSVVTAANNTSLGGGAAVITTGGNLQLQGGVALANTFTVGGTGTTANDGVFQNTAGNNTVSGNVTLAAGTRIQSDSGTLTLAGNTLLGTRTLNIGGSGITTLSGIVSGTAGTAITKDGSGTLTLAGASANTFTGGLQINQGTVVLNKGAGTNALGGGSITVGDGIGSHDSATLRWAANNQLADTTAITLNTDGLLDFNGRAETLGSVNGGGHIMIGTGQLIVGGDNTDSTLSGILTGSDGGVLTKTGTGTLTLTSGDRNGGAINYGGEFNLNAGTLALDDIDFTVETLRLTGDSILDFGGNSTLTVGTLIIELGEGEILSITSWEEWMDYFYADAVQNGDGSIIPDFDNRGDSPLNQIVFAGWTGDNTKWQEYDNQITPVPEPSSYGAILIAGLIGLAASRRRRRT